MGKKAQSFQDLSQVLSPSQIQPLQSKYCFNQSWNTCAMHVGGI